MIASCGPQSIDRVEPTDGGFVDVAASGGSPGGEGGAGGSEPGTGGAGPGSGGADAAPDLAVVEVTPDLAPAEVAPEVARDLAPESPVDLAPEAPAMRTVMLVVGGANPSTAEARLRTTLMGRGFMVRVAQDEAAADVTGVHLVILTETCASATVGIKYRDVTIPVINLEPALMDDMRMTGPESGTAYEQNAGSQINIVDPAHPMAAGLSGLVTAVTGNSADSFMVWGVPAEAAQKVATLMGMPTRFTIFGYPTGAMMVGQAATARRVGFFAGNAALERLNDNGVKLINAAVDWALAP